MYFFNWEIFTNKSFIKKKKSSLHNEKIYDKGSQSFSSGDPTLLSQNFSKFTHSEHTGFDLRFYFATKYLFDIC